MILDTSALMAVLLSEPERGRILDVMDHADRLILSAGSWVELAAVTARQGMPGWENVVRLRQAYAIEIVAVSARQAELASEAYRTYGGGTGHPARLNFGDCFAYALAMDRGEPLLFKGDDFSKTDVRVASY